MAATTDEDIDFDALALKIDANYAQHEENIKKLRIKKSVLTFSQCDKILQEEMKNIKVSPAAPSSVTVADYVKLFKQFEDYPANLQKPKKRDVVQRANINLLKGSFSSLAEATPGNSNSSSSSLNFSKFEEEQKLRPGANEIYNDFKKFQQKLQSAREAFALNIEAEYAIKLRQLGNFSQQLEKLLPAALACPEAFTTVEQEKLIAIATNMAELNYIHKHGSLFPQQCTETPSNSYLETLIEVLNYTLGQLGAYNV